MSCYKRDKHEINRRPLMFFTPESCALASRILKWAWIVKYWRPQYLYLYKIESHKMRFCLLYVVVLNYNVQNGFSKISLCNIFFKRSSNFMFTYEAFLPRKRKIYVNKNLRIQKPTSNNNPFIWIQDMQKNNLPRKFVKGRDYFSEI